jgi:hypothetical protein
LPLPNDHANFASNHAVMTAERTPHMHKFSATTVLFLAGALVAPQPASAQQPCNPVIDGTYCAENMSRQRVPPPNRPNLSSGSVHSIGTDLAVGYDNPGSFGTITFRGSGEACVGLLFRSSCR